MDSRIGPKFLNASVGFGGSCFQKDLLNLVYLSGHFGLPEVANYWQAVIDMNEWQRERFSTKIVQTLFNTVRGKKIGIWGFAFKKDTNDTRESAAIYICRDLIMEGANVAIYDPQVSKDQVFIDLENLGVERAVLDKQVIICNSCQDAAKEAHGVAVLTEWEEFKEVNFKKVYEGMFKPAFLFDGRNVIDAVAVRELGFDFYAIGKG